MAAAAPGAVVTTDGFQLKLNGQPFVIKGMNYSPVPIGAAPRAIFPMAITSFRITPMFGSLISTKCAQAGINVIKLYAGNPELNAGEPGTAGNWKQFSRLLLQ